VWGHRRYAWGFHCPACWSGHFSTEWTQSEAFMAAHAHAKTPTHLWRAVEAANR
jgi:hypothetical protein